MPQTALHKGAGRCPEEGLAAARIRREAFEWQVTLWSGEVTDAEQRDFESWLRADARHQAAWRQVEQVGQQLHVLPSEVAAPVHQALLASRGQRRVALRGAAGLTVAGVVAWMVGQTPPWQIATAVYSTRRGERREEVLPDGTRITLNTATSVDLRFDASERRIVLRSGEIFITTAPDRGLTHRPFVLETEEGRVRPLGTRFAVRHLGGALPSATLVQVVEGAVELAPDGGSMPVRLDAGQKAMFTRQGVAHVLQADEAEAAWARGLLVANRMRLSDFLGELGRYRSGVLRCDPAVADLVVSGVYPLADTDAVLAALAQVLPLRVNSVTRYWVTVAAK